MGLTQKVEDNVMYLGIAQGNLVQKANEDTIGAVKRNYELKDGTKGAKWEIRHKNLTGYIADISFRDSDFGKQCIVKFTDGTDTAVLQINTNSRYFSDFAQKLANVNFNEPVTINPYDFVGDNQKSIKGMSISQLGQKVSNYFWDADSKKVVNGMFSPENRGDGFDSDDWKIYFTKVKKFLISHTEGLMNSIGSFQLPDQSHIDESQSDIPEGMDKTAGYPDLQDNNYKIAQQLEPEENDLPF